MKVSIIGAGAVGATLAQRVLESGLADVVLLDIARNIAVGKALDLSDAAPILKHERHITGTDDYSEIRSSDIVVITAGLTRKPGMTREDLTAKNALIIKDVALKVKAHAAGSIIIVVTNPLDVMTYLAYKTTGFEKERVFGMAGLLDGSRFIYLAANELKVPCSSVETIMLGSHGDTMVPVLSHTRVSGKPIDKILSKTKLDDIVRRTRDRGAEIVNLLGTGSAYYSPSAAVFRVIECILNKRTEEFVVSAYIDGEYGMKDICIGVPCLIGMGGILKVKEIKLTAEEDAGFRKSAGAIRDSIKLL